MRIKDYILSGLMLFAVLAFASCGDDHPIVDNSWNTGTLTVKEEVDFGGGTSQTLNIKAASKPTLTCDAEWLRIGEVRRFTTGIYTVELSADPNVSGETRSAVVSVTCGKESATVKVSQESVDLVEVRQMIPEGVLDPEGGILTIKYAATGTPAANLPEWMSETGTRALEEGTLTLSYQANATGKEREGMIVLAVGNAVTNITVRQGALLR